MGRLRLPVPALVVVALWFLLPIVLSDVEAQDGIPLLVAGALVDQHPEAVYDPDMVDLYDLDPVVREETCRSYPKRAQCLDEGVAFVSPPPALPIAHALAGLERSVAMTVIRLVAVAAMAAGFLLIAWRSFSRADLVPATAAAALLVVDLQRHIELGQTSALLFLLAAVPITRVRGWWREGAVAAVLVVAIALKAFPAVLLLPLVFARRWRLAGLVAAGVGALGVAALLLAPSDLWPEFADLSRAVTRFSVDNPHNASLAAVFEAAEVPGGAPAGTIVGVAIAVVFVAVMVARGADDDLCWAAALPVALLVLPQVWNHYLVLVLPLLVLAASRATPQPRWWLLGAVVAMVPYELTAGGLGSQLLGVGLLLAALAAAAVLLVRFPARVEPAV